MLEEALEHLVKGIVDHAGRRRRPPQGRSSRRGARGARAPGRPRPRHRPVRPHGERAAHRDGRPRGRPAGPGRHRRHRPRPLAGAVTTAPSLRKGHAGTDVPHAPLRLCPHLLPRGTRMDVVVARIGKAHGLRGEVTVEVRTDAPQERFVPGAALPDRARRRPARWTLRERPGPQRHPAARLRRRPRPHRGRGAARGAPAGRHADEAADDDGRVVRERPGRPERASTLAGEPARRGGRPWSPGPTQDLLVVRRPDGREGLVPFVAAIVPEVDVAGGRVVVDPPGRAVRPGRAVSAGRCCASTSSRSSRTTSQPLRPVADRQGPRAGAARPARARPARLHPRPAPHRRRHPVRRRRRAWSCARSRGARRWTTSWPTPRPEARAGRRTAPARARPRRRTVHPGDGPRAGRREPWLAFACGRYEGIDERVLDEAPRRGCRSAWSPSATTC